MFSDSTVRKDANQRPGADASPAAPPGLDTGKQCAYNQSRERFLSADVEKADFSASSLIDNRFPSIAPGAGLWLTPFIGISPTSVRMPVDLIYLDRDCTVLETVESFPLGGGSALNSPSITVLVLAADSLRATETKVGDQLILCPPEEMKQRLKKLANPTPETKAEAAARANTGRVLQWAKSAADKNSMEETVAAEIAATPEIVVPATAAEPEAALAVAPVVEQTAPAAVRVAAPKTGRPEPAKRGWFARLIAPEPADNRKTQRQALPGLAAFFFTGGAPEAHGVRDISLTGMYVYTNERWYPGTMVRMTISDSTDRVAERSITLNTTVVRAGDDGVGLRFVLEKGSRRQRTNDGLSYGADMEQVQEFLLRVKSAQQSQQA
jgi:hypothetical protein